MSTRPELPADEPETREALADELAIPGRARASVRTQPRRAPPRHRRRCSSNGRDAAPEASSGQARSLLLALVLASLEVYREETGRTAVALLDDLDSELDQDRTRALCAEVSAQAQALVTSAHPGWAESLRDHGRLFHVSEGEVHCA